MGGLGKFRRDYGYACCIMSYYIHIYIYIYIYMYQDIFLAGAYLCLASSPCSAGPAPSPAGGLPGGLLPASPAGASGLVPLPPQTGHCLGKLLCVFSGNIENLSKNDVCRIWPVGRFRCVENTPTGCGNDLRTRPAPFSEQNMCLGCPSSARNCLMWQLQIYVRTEKANSCESGMNLIIE